jgi:thiol-disulfide isomerase/thioredoxin
VFAAFVLFLHASPVFAALKTNDIAPTFSLRDREGMVFFLSDVVGETKKGKGSGVIISFFATWCAPCRSELPLINSLVDELKEKGVTVVLVDIKEDFDTIGAFLSELNVDKPVVLSDHDGKIAGKYQIRFLPTTFFIGSDGKVKDMIFGEIFDAKELRQSAGKLLK